MTEVNYPEAKYIVIRKDGDAAWEAAARVLVGLPIELISPIANWRIWRRTSNRASA